MSEPALRIIPNDLPRQVEAALSQWVDPRIGSDLITAGAITRLEAFTFRIYLDVHLGFPANRHAVQLAEALETYLLANTQAQVVEIVVT